MSKEKVTSTFQLEPRLAKKLNNRAKKEGVPKVLIVNQALKLFLDTKTPIN